MLYRHRLWNMLHKSSCCITLTLCCLPVYTIYRQDQSIQEMQLNLDGTVIRPTSVRDRALFVYCYCNSMAIDLEMGWITVSQAKWSNAAFIAAQSVQGNLCLMKYYTFLGFFVAYCQGNIVISDKTQFLTLILIECHIVFRYGVTGTLKSVTKRSWESHN